MISERRRREIGRFFMLIQYPGVFQLTRYTPAELAAERRMRGADSVRSRHVLRAFIG